MEDLCLRHEISAISSRITGESRTLNLEILIITKILVETASDKWRQLMSVMSLSGGKI